MNFDHILLIGYGAPSKTEEVMPFLRAMNEGRRVPEECLNAVAQHYKVIGGGSPYNEQAEGFRDRLEKELRLAGTRLPVFIGMKNWHPFLQDVLPEIHQNGYRRGLAVPLTPYRSSAFGARYQQSLESIVSSQAMTGLSYQFINGWHDEPLFIEAEAEEISCALQAIDPKERAGTPILFSFHSLPVSHEPADSMFHYAEEARVASALVAGQLGHKKWTVVYQSRPVSAQGAWLRPDIEDEVKALAVKREKRVLIAPLGFLCDHAEILYDLDHRTKAVAESGRMQYLRSQTVLSHSKIVMLFKKLIGKSMVAGD